MSTSTTRHRFLTEILIVFMSAIKMVFMSALSKVTHFKQNFFIKSVAFSTCVFFFLFFFKSNVII